MVSQTTHSSTSDSVTSATAAKDHTRASPTCPLSDGTNQLPTSLQSTTSALVSDHDAGEETDKKFAISIVLSATSLIAVAIKIMLCVCKKGSLKNMISKMKGFSINPSRTFRKLKPHTSPIYNSNSSEDEDDTDAL
jgi:hypothetical protein